MSKNYQTSGNKQHIDVDEVRIFDGHMSDDLELWLGDAFESWLPSTQQIIIRVPTGERIVNAGEEIKKVTESVVVTKKYTQ